MRRPEAIPIEISHLAFPRRGAPGPQDRERQEGFTLIELLVVIAILGMLVAFVAPAVVGQLSSAKHRIAEQSVQRLTGLLDLYQLDVGAYPSTDQGLPALYERPRSVTGWNGPYVRDPESLNDPWGKPYRYFAPSQRAGRPYDIVSFGADGISGGEGDNADILNR